MITHVKTTGEQQFTSQRYGCLTHTRSSHAPVDDRRVTGRLGLVPLGGSLAAGDDGRRRRRRLLTDRLELVAHRRHLSKVHLTTTIMLSALTVSVEPKFTPAHF